MADSGIRPMVFGRMRRAKATAPVARAELVARDGRPGPAGRGRPPEAGTASPTRIPESVPHRAEPALNGSRVRTRQHLAESFDLSDRAALLADAYAPVAAWSRWAVRARRYEIRIDFGPPDATIRQGRGSSPACGQILRSDEEPLVGSAFVIVVATGRPSVSAFSTAREA